MFFEEIELTQESEVFKIMVNRARVLVLVSVVLMLANLAHSKDLSSRKVLLIDSYHTGYAWSDGIIDGVKKIAAKEKLTLFIHHMDTKRNGTIDFKHKAGLLAKNKIDNLQPDIVIACDDNASKYLVAPHFKKCGSSFRLLWYKPGGFILWIPL